MISGFMEGSHRPFSSYENFVKRSVFITAEKNTSEEGTFTRKRKMLRSRVQSSPYKDRSLMKENYRTEKPKRQSVGRHNLLLRTAIETQEEINNRINRLLPGGELLNDITV